MPGYAMHNTLQNCPRNYDFSTVVESLNPLGLVVRVSETNLLICLHKHKGSTEPGSNPVLRVLRVQTGLNPLEPGSARRPR